MSIFSFLLIPEFGEIEHLDIFGLKVRRQKDTFYPVGRGFRGFDTGHVWIEFPERGQTASAGLFRPEPCWFPGGRFCWLGRARVNKCRPEQPLTNDSNQGQTRRDEVGSLPIRWKPGQERTTYPQLIARLRERINYYHQNPPIFMLLGIGGMNCRKWARKVLDECGIELVSDARAYYVD